VARAAAAFLHREHRKPFFLGVSLHNPHDICYWVMDKLAPGHPSRAELDTSVSTLPPLPQNHGRSPDEPEFIDMCRQRTYYGQENTFTTTWDELHWRRYLHAYYRMTERVDKACGIVLSALRSTGLERDTILVFTSDHGEGMAAHRWVVKLMFWEEVVAVPLIWRWPGRIPGGKANRSALASGVDVLPTLCDLAGISMRRAPHGASLGPVLRGRAESMRTSLFAQLAPDTKDPSMQGRSVRSSRYKYVRFSKGANPEMLFDLQKDPGETRNLAGDQAHSRLLAEHRKLLQEWMARTGDNSLDASVSTAG
jgi:arylsulfatase A-like enzyme